MIKNYYKILGLEEGANEEEVEKRYNKLLIEFDPKKQSDDDLKEFFKKEQEKVKEAYKKISLSFTNLKEKEVNKEKNPKLVPIILVVLLFFILGLIGLIVYNNYQTIIETQRQEIQDLILEKEKIQEERLEKEENYEEEEEKQEEKQEQEKKRQKKNRKKNRNKEEVKKEEKQEEKQEQEKQEEKKEEILNMSTYTIKFNEDVYGSTDKILKFILHSDNSVSVFLRDACCYETFSKRRDLWESEKFLQESNPKAVSLGEEYDYRWEVRDNKIIITLRIKRGMKQSSFNGVIFQRVYTIEANGSVHYVHTLRGDIAQECYGHLIL